MKFFISLASPSDTLDRTGDRRIYSTRLDFSTGPCPEIENRRAWICTQEGVPSKGDACPLVDGTTCAKADFVPHHMVLHPPTPRPQGGMAKPSTRQGCSRLFSLSLGCSFTLTLSHSNSLALSFSLSLSLSLSLSHSLSLLLSLSTRPYFPIQHPGCKARRRRRGSSPTASLGRPSYLLGARYTSTKRSFLPRDFFPPPPGVPLALASSSEAASTSSEALGLPPAPDAAPPPPLSRAANALFGAFFL